LEFGYTHAECFFSGNSNCYAIPVGGTVISLIAILTLTAVSAVLMRFNMNPRVVPATVDVETSTLEDGLADFSTFLFPRQVA
jgi:hypothetical protein